MIDANKTNSPAQLRHIPKVEFEDEKKEMVVQEEFIQCNERVEDPNAKIF